jgi:hypothetical protein
VPVLTATLGAYATLEQPASAAPTNVKKQAFAKTDAMCLKRKVLPAVSSVRVN